MYASDSEEPDKDIKRVVEAVEQHQQRSRSSGVYQSIRSSGFNPNEFSFREKDDVNQAFIDVKSSMARERPKVLPAHIETHVANPLDFFRPRTPDDA